MGGGASSAKKSKVNVVKADAILTPKETPDKGKSSDEGSKVTEPRAESSPQSQSRPQTSQSPGQKISHQNRVDFPGLFTQARSKWPIRCYGKFDFNVNAYHGGCSSLVMVSCMYGGDSESTAQIFLLKSGFDGNQMQNKSLANAHQGHFGCSSSFRTDEYGNLIPDLLFGSNNALLLSNMAQYGNLDIGTFIKGSKDGSEMTTLPIKLDVCSVCLILCSGKEAGVGASSCVFGLYLMRTSAKKNVVHPKLIAGEDKWTFSADTNSHCVQVNGVASSQFGVIVNNLDRSTKDEKPCSSLTQASDGRHVTTVFKRLDECCTVLVLCSTSTGNGKLGTESGLYYLTIEGQTLKDVKEIGGLCEAETWKFEIQKGRLVVTGPPTPCRYGVLSNIKAMRDEVETNTSQTGCLATGEPHKVQGSVKIDKTGVSGKVDCPLSIYIKMNHKDIITIPEEKLGKSSDGWAFSHQWTDEQKIVGHYLVRVYAIRKHVTSGEQRYTELTGSPYHLTFQKRGVAFAVNCSGPVYQAVSDITYDSEHQHFANFYDGSQSTALGGVKHEGSLPHLLLNTSDGFMQVSARSPGVQADDEQHLIYKVDDIPNGQYMLRVHTCNSTPREMQCNGKDFSKEFKKKMTLPKVIVGQQFTCYVADVDVTVSDRKLKITTVSVMLDGFALLNKDYHDNQLTKIEQDQQQEEKHSLSDSVTPLTNIPYRKVMQIVGWSPNLLQNASGEANNLSHWNTTGDWKVYNDGGYGTEKAFVTSHMDCVKYQEINLLEHYSAEYLDTAPDIQVSEWYREGVNGGGFYSMTAELMDEDGSVIKSYTTGKTGRIYKENAWTNAATQFSNYGSNVRVVSISSFGKDDKFWGGHYGTIISASEIRVKNETKPAEGDKYEDVFDNEMDLVQRNTKRSEQEKMVARVLMDNQELIQSLIDDKMIQSDPQFEKQTHTKVKKRSRALKKREIRVFVSSTFKDFGEEREEIIKKAFREINRVCSERGVFFTYVDLRWGITSEQTEGGKTIAICLQEIDRCRPYFMCMMGERFGWTQKTGTTDETLDSSYNYAIEMVPNLAWIEQFRFDSSVTQLEVFHGVLNNIEAAKGRSFFYMRTPPDPSTMSEIEFKNKNSESEWHHEKQTSLKAEVTKHPELHVAEFTKPSEASDLMKKDLMWCIDQDFPKGTELTKLEQQREAHEAFRDARCQVYIGGEEYFTQINNYRKEGKREPLVLLGESGSGKSALVANWTKRTEDKELDTFIFVHFIGSSADSADYIKLLHRLYEEIKEYFNLDLAVPSTDAQLVQELVSWLTIAGSRTKCVLVFDALNQLDDGSGEDGSEHDLRWIPSMLPDNVFLLLSTLPGRAFEACKSFNWMTLKVEPLDISMKEQIVTGYLEGIYGKTLNAEQKSLIIDARQTNNPLYLRSLLDELRMYGRFRTLTEKIREFLTAESPGELFAKILERLEEDFEQAPIGRKDLVRDATVAIWCSHRGMSESELVDLLQVPSAVWSPFYLSVVENLVNRNGILNFFHDHLRQAVEKKYLSTPELKKQGYLGLVDYFDAKPRDSRTVDELPFLLIRAKEMTRLKKTISDLDVFCKMSESEDGQFELIKAWQCLGDFSNVEESYRAELDKLPKDKEYTQSDENCKLLSHLAGFYLEIGILNASRIIFQSLLETLEERFMKSHGTVVYEPFVHSWRYACKHPDVVKNLDNLGMVYTKLQDLPKAAEMYTESLSRQNKVVTPTEKIQLAQGLIGLASVYVMQDNMVEAKKLLTRALELGTEVLGAKHHFVAAMFTKLGQLSYKQSRLDESLGFFLQDLKVTRSEVGTHHPRTAIVLNEIALVYDDKTDSLAGQLYETALSIFLDTYGPNYVGTAVVRYNLGAFYFGTNYFEKAHYQFEKAYQIFETFYDGDHPDTKAAKEALDLVRSMSKRN